MRIGFVTSALVRGGAELQILKLAEGLRDRGHQLHVIAYDGPSVLDDSFRAAGVEVSVEPSATRGHKVGAVRRWMRRSRVEVVHGVLRRASIVSLLARWPGRRPVVIVTDYSAATYGRRTAPFWASLAGFAWADRVVTEVELNRDSLERLAPWLRGKVAVIRNGLDVERFVPASRTCGDTQRVFAFCVVGTVSEAKNPLRVIDAVAELRRRGHDGFQVHWHGRDGVRRRVNHGEEARAYAAARGVAGHLVFHGDTPEIVGAYQRADALLHASVHEGFPNAVAEGMACGLPVVLSRVSDLPRVVAKAHNGFVFDETDPSSIADAMERIMALPGEQRAAMGVRSRELAVHWFRQERFLDEYEALYRSLCRECS